MNQEFTSTNEDDLVSKITVVGTGRVEIDCKGSEAYTPERIAYHMARHLSAVSLGNADVSVRGDKVSVLTSRKMPPFVVVQALAIDGVDFISHEFQKEVQDNLQPTMVERYTLGSMDEHVGLGRR